MFIYSRIALWIGSKNTFFFGVCVQLLLCMYCPLLLVAADSGWSDTSVYIALVGLSLIKAVAFPTAMLSLQVMIVNTTPSKSLGSVNGFAQSVASAFRSIGPILVGELWDWGLDFGAWGSVISFGAVAFFVIILMILCRFTVPDELNFKQ